ncbi:hypothetical protein RQP46_000245 [Phenoliferia psychrophenolica]
MSTLPVELLQEIIGHLDPEDLATLSRCCLVARTLLPIARRALYGNITLHFVPSPSPSLLSDALSPPVLTPGSFALENTLLLHPHLRTIPTGVRLWDDQRREDTPASSFNHPAHTIRAMWATLPNLDKLVIMDATVSFPALAAMVQGLVAAQDTVATAGTERARQLRFLSIFEGGGYDYGAPLRDLLRSLPLLERLLIGEVHLPPSDDHTRPTFHLTHLVVRSDSSKGRFLPFLTSASHDSLVSAALPIDSSKYDFGEFTRLQTVSFTFRCWAPFRKEKEAKKSVKKIVAALATAPPSLRCVEIIENWEANGISAPHAILQTMGLLEGIPAALDIVNLHGVSLEVAYLVSFLRDAPAGLAWKELRLGCRFVDPKGALTNDEGTLDEVEKACRARGIAVSFRGNAQAVRTP